jgi:CheY-like chemotaxis protein
VLKLTQEGAADYLHMSVSTIKRAQREATHALARRLWARRAGADAPRGTPAHEPGPASMAARDLQEADWPAQARRELALLDASAPGAVADVGAVVDDVLEFQRALAPREAPPVTVDFIQPGLVAAVHPALLRQMLIAALGKLAAHPAAEEVCIYGGLQDGNVRITLASPLASEAVSAPGELSVEDVLVPDGGAVWAGVDGDRLAVSLELPSVGRTTVLVVDDNEDMARFYRRSTAGTRYHIVHAACGRDVPDAIDTSAPDAIVLDVMLPDVDGWRLLMHLREDPATADIPVIVSSVVREEQLARSLGAAAYLSKPVRPRQFIQVLDEVLGQRS